VDLIGDPYERAYLESDDYSRWLAEHQFVFVPVQDLVGKFLMTFKEYPQRQAIGTFNLDGVLETLKEAKQN